MYRIYVCLTQEHHMGLLAVANLIGLVWMTKIGLRLLSDYDKQLKAGEEPTLSRANFDDLDLDPKAWPK